jgi:hypothetical protein
MTDKKLKTKEALAKVSNVHPPQAPPLKGGA